MLIRLLNKWLSKPEPIPSPTQADDVICSEKKAAGDKAEQVFAQQARDEDWIIDILAQDKTSFQQFNSMSVKRADFIVRGLNVDVEVKCLTKYGNQSEPYFLLPYKDIKKHESMDAHTQSRSVFAIYERDENNVIETSLRMVELDYLLARNRTDNLYDKDKKCLRVYVKNTMPDLKLLDYIARRDGSAPKE